ncbi:MAG: ATP-binding protein [Cyanobacteria bacterium P01_D01_bin.73]
MSYLKSHPPSNRRPSSEQLRQLRDRLDESLQSVASLMLFPGAITGEPGQMFMGVLHSLRDASYPSTSPLESYGDWFRALAQDGRTWRAWIIDCLLKAENPFSEAAQSKDFADLPTALVTAARQDLQAMGEIAGCDDQELAQWSAAFAPRETSLPRWEGTEPEPVQPTGKQELEEAIAQLPLTLNESQNWGEHLETLAAYYRQIGIGTYCKTRAFRWRSRQLSGISRPSAIALTDLVGYDRAKEALVRNTEFLLGGHRALNVLLYGSRGSGKSSLVKALLSEYSDRGLRLVEVAKDELRSLPDLVDRLSSAPDRYKFIVFVDDLSFEEDDNDFKALKVVLEGSTTERPDNVVVYATTNRRHLVREYFEERPRPKDADEIHNWDTVQEKLSFSDRFGLTLTFEPANQDKYLDIVNHLASQAELDIEAEQLRFRALQWATQHNGRSGRSARQFIDYLTAELAMELAADSASESASDNAEEAPTEDASNSADE